MDHFTPIYKLGSGTFGTVWRMDWNLPSGLFVPVAIKRIRMEPELSFPEFDMVANCDHPNVIKGAVRPLKLEKALFKFSNDQDFQ